MTARYMAAVDRRGPGGCAEGDGEMSSVPLLGYHSTIPWLPLIPPRSSPRHFLVDAGAGLGIIPTRVALPDGLTEEDSANAVRSPWSAVPSATQLASP